MLAGSLLLISRFSVIASNCDLPKHVSPNMDLVMPMLAMRTFCTGADRLRPKAFKLEMGQLLADKSQSGGRSDECGGQLEFEIYGASS